MKIQQWNWNETLTASLLSISLHHFDASRSMIYKRYIVWNVSSGGFRFRFCVCISVCVCVCVCVCLKLYRSLMALADKKWLCYSPILISVMNSLWPNMAPTGEILLRWIASIENVQWDPSPALDSIPCCESSADAPGFPSCWLSKLGTWGPVMRDSIYRLTPRPFESQMRRSRH